MSRQIFDAFSFDPPAGRQMLTSYRVTDNDGRRVCDLILTRCPRANGAALFFVVLEWAQECAKRLSGWKVDAFESMKVAGRDAVWTAVRWMGKSGEVVQTAVHVDDGTPDAVLVVTCAAEAGRSADCAAELSRLLGSAVFEASPEPSRPSSTPAPDPRCRAAPAFTPRPATEREHLLRFPMPGDRRSPR